MSEDPKVFFELAKTYEKLKSEIDQVVIQLDVAMRRLGYDTYHQDPETNLVYKVIGPTGCWTKFKNIDYVRTKKEDEKQGSLSKKECETLGFKV